MIKIYGIKQRQIKKHKLIGHGTVYDDMYTDRQKAIDKITGIMDQGVGVGNWTWIGNNKDQTFTMANALKTEKPYNWSFHIIEKQLYTDQGI